jgi:hypothetical protein
MTLALPHSLQRRRFTKAAIGASGLRPNRLNSALDRTPFVLAAQATHQYGEGSAL